VIGLRPGVSTQFAAMNMLMLPKRTLFICDTYVNLDPSAEQIAEMTLLAAEEVRRFGSSRRWRCCRIRTSAARRRPARRRCATRWRSSAPAPDFESTARCTATRRCRRTVRNHDMFRTRA
jgi:malate dehydrogenase (oxaloacetate-decarboxylating)(NADP+)